MQVCLNETFFDLIQVICFDPFYKRILAWFHSSTALPQNMYLPYGHGLTLGQYHSKEFYFQSQRLNEVDIRE